MNTPDFFALIAAQQGIDPALREFFGRAPITVRGSERQREVRDEEAADQRADERRDQLERGE